MRLLLLHPHLAAPGGAQLAGEPLGRATLPVGGRRPFVGGQLAHDGLGKQASNFILGHGALAPQTSADYPPGHQVDGIIGCVA